MTKYILSTLLVPIIQNQIRIEYKIPKSCK